MTMREASQKHKSETLPHLRDALRSLEMIKGDGGCIGIGAAIMEAEAKLREAVEIAKRR